ncbi:glycosyltransferase family 4 protein [Catellatospora paridis]|uniref:glycosyltransferase family 4 protein n=1 Tax=Catellatospora paridis TaxID=1617086 RepID=UPI0012D4BD15|nr:glycosyltransferase family 1 protein [Catellatospora paridis]
MTRASHGRLTTLANALGRQAAGGAKAGSALSSLIDPLDRAQVWLAIAVLTGQLPDDETVIRVARTAELEPAREEKEFRALASADAKSRNVRVVSRDVVVDVGNTVRTNITSGIQRVVRDTVSRWAAERDGITLVAWTPEFTAMRGLTQREAAVFGIVDASLPDDEELTDLIVPWHATVVTPELAAEPDRARRMRALGLFSRNAVGSVAFDLVPIVVSETTTPGMPDGFSRHLTALRHSQRIATISHSVALEYEGWKSGLAAIGLAGPSVVAVPLPVQAGDVPADVIGEAERQLRLGGLPMVLAVGSHEPRKNHLSILEAAERLWREGHEFCLVFIGGHSWGSDEFVTRAAALSASGRPIRIVTKASDDLIWAAYRLARFTVFPSFYEGFGLPAAESIAVGTPCITSNFGSMREIGEGGGALLVDTYSDTEVRDAMRRLLTDDELLQQLRMQARSRPPRTWDDYARDLWNDLVVPLRADVPDFLVPPVERR